MSALARFRHWDVLALFLALAIVLVLELMGVFSTRFVTITAIVRAYIPRWLRAMLLGWLCYHFLVQ